ncbi:MAG: invasion associated locus B family protein [Alphaproteobacteria bacterium]
MHTHIKRCMKTQAGPLRAMTLALILGAQPVSAAQTLLGSNRDWDAFTVTEGKTKSCYMRAAPAKSEPAGAKRSDIYLFITHRPASKVTNEVSVIAGYPFKPGSAATMTIGKQKFSLFTEGDGAWIEKPADEARLIAAMQQGDKLTISGTSQRGTKTTDTYSLAGFSAALKSINEACGVK